MNSVQYLDTHCVQAATRKTCLAKSVYTCGWLLCLVLLPLSSLASQPRISAAGQEILLDNKPAKMIGLRRSYALISDATTNDLQETYGARNGSAGRDFSAGRSRPNIVLFVSDDHGMDALGCYGNPVVKTPHMDQLAAEGVRFTRAYCTSASCAASRSVILTGQYGHATGSYGHVHDYHHFSTYETVKSLPVLLEAAGYLTARIGKYHVAPESVFHFNTVLEADPRSTVEMAEACQAVVESDRPFFLYFCPDDPHRGHPFTPDPWDAPNTFGNRPQGYPGVKKMKYDPQEVLVPSFLPDTKECREELAEYYQSVSRIDQGLGKLQALLHKAGKAENTVILYISDNGIAFPGAKTTVYEPGIRLPCIVKDPRSKHKGLVNQAMISWVDLVPTILDFADVTYAATDFHGRSFVPVLDRKIHRVGMRSMPRTTFMSLPCTILCVCCARTTTS